MNSLRRINQSTRSLQHQRILNGLDRALDNLRGRQQRRSKSNNSWDDAAEAALLQAQRLRDISDAEFKQQLKQLRDSVRRWQYLRKDDSIQCFALLAEAARRTLGLQPYKVQLIGAMVLNENCLAEMATGEGKTLTAALAAVIRGWTGQPCHLLTANDYLAQRDARWLSPFYRCCELSVAAVSTEMDDKTRQRVYRNDIVYLTGKELLADFLRDRLLLTNRGDAYQRHLDLLLKRRQGDNDPVMRGICHAIVDEADSVMIDEATTPLILSQERANNDLEQACLAADAMARKMVQDQDFLLDKPQRRIRLTARGLEQLSQWRPQLAEHYNTAARHKELLHTALTAHHCFVRDVDYLICDDRVAIIDEFTGRMMPERSWRQGLHQAIEIAEGLPPRPPSHTLAQLSFQNFFRFFTSLSGTTGTAQETASELWSIYRLPVIRIPLNKPGQRQRNPLAFYQHSEDKWQAICTEIAHCYNSAQPVLVGTRSVAASEALAQRLTQRAIPFKLLNALKHREEAEIIASAGHPGQVTIATNMAGRGTDISLDPHLPEDLGLRVILSEPHESKRIDRQLEGRCARQGQPGQVSFYASAGDDLLRSWLPAPLQKLLPLLEHSEKLKSRLALRLIRTAQKNAERAAARQRRSILRRDEELDELLCFNRSSR